MNKKNLRAFMKTTRKLLTSCMYSMPFVLLLYSYAYSQTHTYNRNPGYGAIWGIIICAWICNKRRQKAIGGWLLYYYIQLYIGMIWFSIFTLTSLENYIPGNWNDQTLYLYYLLSVTPQDIATIAELIVASLLLKNRFRNSSKVNLLKIVFVFSIIFSIIGVIIDYFYWKESIPFEILGLVSYSFWLLYFIFSKRVKSVLIDNNWKSYDDIMQKEPIITDNKTIENDEHKKDIVFEPTDEANITNNKFKLFSSFKKLPKGIFRLIVVFSFVISTLIGFFVEMNERSSDGEAFIIFFVLSMALYWFLVRIGIWIYDGFIEDRA